MPSRPRLIRLHTDPLRKFLSARNTHGAQLQFECDHANPSKHEEIQQRIKQKKKSFVFFFFGNKFSTIRIIELICVTSAALEMLYGSVVVRAVLMLCTRVCLFSCGFEILVSLLVVHIMLHYSKSGFAFVISIVVCTKIKEPTNRNHSFCFIWIYRIAVNVIAIGWLHYFKYTLFIHKFISNEYEYLILVHFKNRICISR